MLTYLEEIIESLDPKGKVREQQHESITDAIEQVTDIRVLRVLCLLSETSLQIRQCDTPDQVLCLKLLENIVLNVGQFSEPSVAAMFERDLFEIEQH